jgi:hypothetical protein
MLDNISIRPEDFRLVIATCILQSSNLQVRVQLFDMIRDHIASLLLGQRRRLVRERVRKASSLGNIISSTGRAPATSGQRISRTPKIGVSKTKHEQKKQPAGKYRPNLFHFCTSIRLLPHHYTTKWYLKASARNCQHNCVKLFSAGLLWKGRFVGNFFMDFDLQVSSNFKTEEARRV